MSNDDREMGEVFKAKRKELNLSLKEVENSTSIRSTYLGAIEEGKKDKFLSPVYMLGFISQYAKFLGIEKEKIVCEYLKSFEETAERHDFAYGIGTLEARGAHGGGVKWLPNLIWATLCALILVLAYFFSKYLGLF